MENYFIELNEINVNDKVEKKNGLSYLSWSFAWGELKKRHPDATYTIYENKDGLFYHTDGNTAWVKTGVTVNDIEHIEYLPVMDFRNKSIPVSNITSFDVNKAIQRSLTKAVARHGLGLYIYAGEDLPEEPQQKDVFEKEVIAEKARHTKEVNKAVKEYQTSERGLDERFESAMSMLNKMPKVEPTQEALITRINALLFDLLNVGQNERHDKLKSLIDSKMEKPFKDDDIIFGKEE